MSRNDALTHSTPRKMKLPRKHVVGRKSMQNDGRNMTSPKADVPSDEMG
jgi:hypothetical protein